MLRERWATTLEVEIAGGANRPGGSSPAWAGPTSLGLSGTPAPPTRPEKPAPECIHNVIFIASELCQVCLTLTPALARSLDARSASNGVGMGMTGRSLVEIPLCWRDMCECKEFLDLATVPHRTHLKQEFSRVKSWNCATTIDRHCAWIYPMSHLYPGHTVCLSSMCVRSVCAER